MKKNIIMAATVILAALASLSSCEKAENSVLPHISSLTLSNPLLELGEKGEAKLTFDQPGANIRGYYKYTINPGNVTGTFDAIPTSLYNFEFDTPDEAGTYTITVTCNKVELYSGYQLWHENGADIGSASATFTMVEDE